MDLRTELIVLTVLEIEKDRYYSIQLIDTYTFNFCYVGSRATGNGAGGYMIAGPNWKGDTSPGVKKVIPSEIDGGLTLYVENESPEKEKEPNWLPAPKRAVHGLHAHYWPKEPALGGTWKQPPMIKV